MKTKQRRVTYARSWDRRSDDKSGVSETAWGDYRVSLNGYCVAQTTDKWMAELILAECLIGRKVKDK